MSAETAGRPTLMANQRPNTGIALTDSAYSALHLLAHRRILFVQNSSIGATELVHEAVLRLIHSDAKACTGSEHFIATALIAMRHVLIDRARWRTRDKRRAKGRRVPLSIIRAPDSRQDQAVASLSDALLALKARSQRAHDVLILRFYGGLSPELTAARLGVSAATVKRDWTFARAWLHRRLTDLERT